MSTRCQVLVEQKGAGWNQKVMLYHHCDGYPTNMLPLILRAFKEGEIGWEKGRAGKVASFLCAADPGGFEPESGFQLHGDIEWFYHLKVVNKQGGSMAEKPSWIVDVYRPGEGFWTKDNPTMKDLKLVTAGEIGSLTAVAGKIEDDA
jgi:hypothetical protein